jgi:hypothetical protein
MAETWRLKALKWALAAVLGGQAAHLLVATLLGPSREWRDLAHLAVGALELSGALLLLFRRTRAAGAAAILAALSGAGAILISGGEEPPAAFLIYAAAALAAGGAPLHRALPGEEGDAIP